MGRGCSRSSTVVRVRWRITSAAGVIEKGIDSARLAGSPLQGCLRLCLCLCHFLSVGIGIAAWPGHGCRVLNNRAFGSMALLTASSNGRRSPAVARVTSTRHLMLFIHLLLAGLLSGSTDRAFSVTIVSSVVISHGQLLDRWLWVSTAIYREGFFSVDRKQRDKSPSRL